jgi:hypothetical protein
MPENRFFLVQIDNLGEDGSITRFDIGPIPWTAELRCAAQRVCNPDWTSAPFLSHEFYCWKCTGAG